MKNETTRDHDLTREGLIRRIRAYRSEIEKLNGSDKVTTSSQTSGNANTKVTITIALECKDDYDAEIKATTLRIAGVRALADQNVVTGSEIKVEHTSTKIIQ